MLSNEKILVTGATSQVGLPVIGALAADNEIHGLSRFNKQEDIDAVQALGARAVAFDLLEGDVDALDDDYSYVLNFAVMKTGDFAYDIAANAEGTGRLMRRCRKAKAFLHCSSAAVYEYAANVPRKEDDPLGDNHRPMMPTYSISKIAAETVVRFAAREYDLPTTIARFSVPYGDNGGWPWYHLLMMASDYPIPIHADQPNRYNLIHEDDYIAHLPKLLEIASVPAITINWGGEPASIEEWCAYLGELTGLEPKLEESSGAIGGLPLDLEKMTALLGPTRVGWREGIRRMVTARNPELLRSDR